MKKLSFIFTICATFIFASVTNAQSAYQMTLLLNADSTYSANVAGNNVNLGDLSGFQFFDCINNGTNIDCSGTITFFSDGSGWSFYRDGGDYDVAIGIPGTLSEGGIFYSSEENLQSFYAGNCNQVGWTESIVHLPNNNGRTTFWGSYHSYTCENSDVSDSLRNPEGNGVTCGHSGHVLQGETERISCNIILLAQVTLPTLTSEMGEVEIWKNQLDNPEHIWVVWTDATGNYMKFYNFMLLESIQYLVVSTWKVDANGYPLDIDEPLVEVIER